MASRGSINICTPVMYLHNFRIGCRNESARIFASIRLNFLSCRRCERLPLCHVLRYDVFPVRHILSAPIKMGTGNFPTLLKKVLLLSRQTASASIHSIKDGIQDKTHHGSWEKTTPLGSAIGCTSWACIWLMLWTGEQTDS